MKTQTDITISMLKANLLAIPIIIISITVQLTPFLLIWDWQTFISAWYSTYLQPEIFIPAFIILALLHEIIHAISFHLIGQKSFSTIKIGFQLKTLTPYAHCKEPLTIKAYRSSVIMPGLIIGIIPSIIALLFGISWLLIYGITFTVAAGGDFLMLWLLRKVKKNTLVEDHPTRVGCYIYTQ